MTRPSALLVRCTALALVTAAGTAGAQVQASFYAPYTASSTAPSPTAPFTTGSPVCTTTGIGNSSGFSLDFISAATQTLLAAACGADVAPLLVHSFGVRFTGSLVAPTAGTYTLAFNSDDGNVLTINGVTVASNWADQGSGPGSISVALNRGANPFVFDYYENTFGGAFATLQLPPDLPAEPPPVTGVIPEPSTVALVAVGMAGIVAAGRRRRVA